MSLDLAPGPLVNTAGAVLLVVLGALVLRVRPRRRANVYLAAFLAGLGAWATFYNLLRRDDLLAQVLVSAGGAAIVVASVGVVGLALHAPPGAPRPPRRMLALPALVGAVVAATRVPGWGGLQAYMAARGYPPDALVATVLSDEPFTAVFFPAMAAFLVLMPLRFGASRDARERGQFALMAAALAVYPGFLAGVFVVTPVQYLFWPGVGLVLALLVSLALWVANTRAGPRTRAARDVALFSLGLVPAGMAMGLFLGGINGAIGAGLFGAARTVAFVLLAYAILRHQMLGIDVTLKWTIRRGTLAGIFLAVFFVGTELGQNVLSDELGAVAGGLAAGLLLFAIAPLQRFAERVADTALPGVRAPAEMSPDERQRAYLDAARAAWADGALSRDERSMLRAFQQGLGLSDAECQRLERQAERLA